MVTALQLGIDIIATLIILTMLVWNIINWCTLNFTEAYLTDINLSLEQIPLFKFTLEKTACPAGSEAKIWGNWDGTRFGCDCTQTTWHTYTSTRIYREGCSFNQTLAGCKTVPHFPSAPLLKWKGNLFCVSSQENLNYKALLQNAVKNGETCKTGYHQCGVLDTLDQILCLPNGDNCPVNDLYIDGLAMGKSTNYTDQELSTNTFIHYTNTEITKPIWTTFKLSHGDVCINPGETNVPSKEKEYPLDDNYNNYGCSDKILNKWYDDRYTKLDESTRGDVYKDNNIDSIVAKLPHYPQELLSNEYSWYERTYWGFDKKCWDETIDRISKAEMDKAIKKKKTANSLHIANMVFISLITIWVVVIFVNNQCFTEPDQAYFSSKTLVFLLLFMFLGVIVWGLGAGAFGNWTRIELNLQCGDEVTNEELRIVQNAFNRLKYFNLFIFIGMITTMWMYLAPGFVQMYEERRGSNAKEAKMDPMYRPVRPRDPDHVDVRKFNQAPKSSSNTAAPPQEVQQGEDYPTYEEVVKNNAINTVMEKPKHE